MDVGTLIKRGGGQWDGWVGRKPAAPALKPALTAPESDSVGLQKWSEAAVGLDFT